MARASQFSTAVRLVAQGLGVTVVPASAVVMLDQLDHKNWCGTALLDQRAAV